MPWGRTGVSATMAGTGPQQRLDQPYPTGIVCCRRDTHAEAVCPEPLKVLQEMLRLRPVVVGQVEELYQHPHLI